MSKKGPESLIQQAIMEYLAAENILCFRMNSGRMFGEHKGKRWAVTFGVPGMADVLAFERDEVYGEDGLAFEYASPVWLECKAPKGTQSEAQKSFQALVESHGHTYAVVRSIEDVKAVLEAL